MVGIYHPVHRGYLHTLGIPHPACPSVLRVLTVAAVHSERLPGSNPGIITRKREERLSEPSKV